MVLTTPLARSTRETEPLPGHGLLGSSQPLLAVQSAPIPATRSSGPGPTAIGDVGAPVSTRSTRLPSKFAAQTWPSVAARLVPWPPIGIRARDAPVAGSRRSTTSSKKLATQSESPESSTPHGADPASTALRAFGPGAGATTVTRRVVARPARPRRSTVRPRSTCAPPASRGVQGDRQTRYAAPSTEQRNPPCLPVADRRNDG